jgi:penicillin-binding protein 1A
MKAVSGALPVRGFVPPASVQVRTIDKRTGLLAPTEVALENGTMGPPRPEDVMEEYFVAGTEPVDVAEPAALPAGDALLDLYGDGDERIPSNQPAAPAADAIDPVAPPASPGPDTPAAGGGLPSVTDDP